MPGPWRRQLVGFLTALLVVLGAGLTTTGVAPATAVSLRTSPAHRHRAAHPHRRAHRDSTAHPHRRAHRDSTAHRHRRAHRDSTVHRRAAHRRAARRWASVKPHDPRTWITFAPDDYTPPPGPHFNDPYGSEARRRALVTQVIRTIDSSPGYRLRNPVTHRRLSCPTDPRYFPSVIKIGVYSIADPLFADAVAAANRRCVSIQVLMNSHLTTLTSHSWAHVISALGPRGRHYRQKRSFAHRCSNGCRGTAVMHAKFYLFSRPGKARYTVMVGSSNMSSNAVAIQWNDLFTADGNHRLYRQYDHMFAEMAPDRPSGGVRVFRAGRYTSTFYPDRDATSATDKTMQALRTIRCTGARDGAGIGGRSVLYIAMHSWHGARGAYLAREVRDLYDRGCYVRILYSFMAQSVYSELTYATGPRMTARRVLFPGPQGVVASKYSHMKMFAASGNIRGDRSAWVVWTGSSNWSNRSLRSDEVTLRIPSRHVYDLYVRQWKAIRHRRSSPVWAIYLEPNGGGRAP